MTVKIKYNKKTQKITLIIKKHDLDQSFSLPLTMNEYLNLIKPIYDNEDLNDEHINSLDTDLTKTTIALKIHEIINKIAKKQHSLTDDKIQMAQPECKMINNKIMIKNFAYQKFEEIPLKVAINYLKYLESLKKDSYLSVKDYSDFF